MSYKHIKCILFDMDGTVLNSEPLFDKAQLLLLNEYGVKASTKDLNEFRGMSNINFYSKFTKKFMISEDIETLRSKLRNYLHKAMKTQLFFIDGFEYFYKTVIKKGIYKVGLVTNTTRLTYAEIQKNINIDNYFSYVITVSEAHAPKPSPAPYLQAMKYFNLNPSETIIVEDSKVGLISAVNTKAHVFGIKTTLNTAQIKSIDKKIVPVDSYVDLENFLKN
ncbi:MAG: hypothetical protein CBD58_00600 [bacterium TMED198]|nr:MAG: hypothetical protein CBD58_00600 [bacterium TMED198]